MDEPRPLDLSALDRYPDAASVDRAVDRALARCGGALARRRARGPVDLVAGWVRPTLAAAAVVAIVSLLAPRAGGESAAAAAAGEVAGALGITEPMAALVGTDSPPTKDDLLYAVEEMR